MANFTRGTNGNNSSAKITPGTSDKVITLSTAGKYVDKDIVITIAGVTAEAHSSYTPNNTYFTTTNTGLGLVEANKYATSAYYVKAGNATASGTKASAVSGTSSSYYVTPSVTKTAGGVGAGSANGTAISFNTIALQTNQDFVIDDGSNSWTWKKDSNGNICVI